MSEDCSKAYGFSCSDSQHERIQPYQGPPVTAPASRIITAEHDQNTPCSEYTTERCMDGVLSGWRNCIKHYDYKGDDYRDYCDHRSTYWSGGWYRCWRPDKPFCRIGLSSQGRDPLIDGYFVGAPDPQHEAENTTSRKLYCAYDMRDIDTEAQMRELENKRLLSTLSDEDQDLLMTNYCSQVTEGYCVFAPDGSGRRMPRCTRFFESTGEGTRCRSWYQDLQRRRPGYASSLRTTVCRNNDSLEECACYNRFQDPAYTLFVDSLAANPGCWYWPCKNAQSAWIPEEIEPGECPGICETAVNIAANVEGDVTLDNITQRINCNFGGLTDQTYSCYNGECVQAVCQPGVDTNCYASSTCGGVCQGLFDDRYQCHDGSCRKMGCNLGDYNCYAYQDCDGACSSRYTCRNGECLIDPSGEFESGRICAQKCGSTETSEGSDIPWGLWILAGCLLAGLVTAFILVLK